MGLQRVGHDLATEQPPPHAYLKLLEMHMLEIRRKGVSEQKSVSFR